MVPFEVWLLVGSALAFSGVVWLLVRSRVQGDRGFAALADAEGWDYRPEPPMERTTRLAALAAVGDVTGGGAYFAGRSPAGPFEFLSGVVGKDQKGGHWTLVRVRTASPCGGLWVGPSPRFRPTGAGLHHEAERFARRFDVRGQDLDSSERFLDEGTRRMLLRPQSSVRIGWEGRDFVVAFPFSASSDKGVRTLLTYATTLASRAEGAPPQARRKEAVAPAATPDPLAV